jgi:hypothetical protein
MFFLCYFWQSTPLLSELMCFSVLTFWSFELFCSALNDQHPLYPLFELMHSSLSIVFGPWGSLVYFFILFLSLHSNLSQVAPLSLSLNDFHNYMMITINAPYFTSFKYLLSLSYVVPFSLNNSRSYWRWWLMPLFHIFQLSPLSKLCCSFLSLNTLVITSNGNQHPIFSFLSSLSSLWVLLLFSLFKHCHSC